VSDTIPGLQRKRRGKGFAYALADGRPIDNPELRAWIESIRIPPAWKDVWISPIQNGHLLATGRDARGRKQYRYHPVWMARRNEEKFGNIAAFGRCLPTIRATTAAHLKRPGLPREKVLAAVIRLLESTFIRVGNREYVRANESYGLTTLEDQHVDVSGSTVHFEFVGKSGIEHSVNLEDRRLARIVKACRDIPGYPLFQYYADGGQPQPIGSADVNAYLREISGEDFTAKTFRTWGASIRLIALLTALPDPASATEAEQQVRDTVKDIAAELGNTVAICRKYYLHPAIFEAHRAGDLKALVAKEKTGDSPEALTAEESALVRLAESHTSDDVKTA
jgi:DNA topoisomerase-1